MALTLPDHAPKVDCCLNVLEGVIRIHDIPVCIAGNTADDLLGAADRAEARAQSIRDALSHRHPSAATVNGVRLPKVQRAMFEHQWWATAFRFVAEAGKNGHLK